MSSDTNIHDTIILVRHGKPSLSRKVRLSAREYRDWWKLYDAGGIVPDQRVPKKVLKWASKADVFYSSPLRRAVESLELASGRRPDIELEELVEAPLPSPPLPIKLRPKSWGTWARIVWFLGWSDGMETHREARRRANTAAEILDEASNGGKIIYVQGHGWFNRMVKGSLMARGWKCVSQNGDLHWSHRRMVRKQK